MISTVEYRPLAGGGNAKVLKDGQILQMASLNLTGASNMGKLRMSLIAPEKVALSRFVE